MKPNVPLLIFSKEKKCLIWVKYKKQNTRHTIKSTVPQTVSHIVLYGTGIYRKDFFWLSSCPLFNPLGNYKDKISPPSPLEQQMIYTQNDCSHTYSTFSIHCIVRRNNWCWFCMACKLIISYLNIRLSLFLLLIKIYLSSFRIFTKNMGIQSGILVDAMSKMSIPKRFVQNWGLPHF